VARSRGTGAHARARVLASQGRGVAVPCTGHGHPGPAARCGGEEATAAAGCGGGAMGSCTKGGTKAGRERWSYGWATEGSSALLAIGG
jgi:hypothetical protein